MTTPPVRRAPAPAVGSRPSVRVDQDLHDDLAVLLRAGGTVSDVIRDAVRHLADAYRTAWDYELVPDGTAPRIVGARYHPPTPRDARPSDTSDGLRPPTALRPTPPSDTAPPPLRLRSQPPPDDAA